MGVRRKDALIVGGKGGISESDHAISLGIRYKRFTIPMGRSGEAVNPNPKSYSHDDRKSRQQPG